MTKLIRFDHTRSHNPIKTAKIATDTITTIVALISSRLVDHETFFNSSLTSFTNFATLFIFFTANHVIPAINMARLRQILSVFDFVGQHPPKPIFPLSYLGEGEWQERQGSNLQSRLWRPLVCQLTDAPKLIFKYQLFEVLRALCALGINSVL